MIVSGNTTIIMIIVMIMIMIIINTSTLHLDTNWRLKFERGHLFYRTVLPSSGHKPQRNMHPFC